METDWFQETFTDLFQKDYSPGRPILESVRLEVESSFGETYSSRPNALERNALFYRDEENTSEWITVVYKSVFDADRASKQLPNSGLNVYYPKTRHKSTAIEKYMQSLKGEVDDDSGRMVPALGRYLLIQVPYNPETLEKLEITQTFLEGPFNRNGVLTILANDGDYSITLNCEVESNRRFHVHRNKELDPKVALRFKEGETVLVGDGNLKGYFVKLNADIPMIYKLKSKVPVVVLNGSIYYVRLSWLEKV